MKNLTLTSILAAALATGMILALTITPTATAENFYCSDRQTFSAFNNIIVAEGQTCVLDQFNVVQGDIVVNKGATLIVCADNDIAGSILADGAETVSLIDAVGGPCVGALSSASDVEASSIDYELDGSKVTICHKPGTSAEKELQVPSSAVQGHLDHGDRMGSCTSPPLPPPKALGLAIMGSIDVTNTSNFLLIGNTEGITLVRGDVSVQNTESVGIINVGGVAMAGQGIGGDLTVSSSGSCSISGNMVVGNTELSGCSNLAN